MVTSRNEPTGEPATAVPLPAGGDLWDRVFVAAPLVLVGTVEEDGAIDLAPKHQAMPLGWTDRYGFVCTSSHHTHGNVLRTGQFTVSYPTPDVVVAIGQAAGPRLGADKPSLVAVEQIPAVEVEGALAARASLWLECRLDRVIEGFGPHDLIVGRIVRAAAPGWAVRDPDRDDADALHENPALVFLSPSRFAGVAETLAFPFPVDFSR